MLHVAVFFHLKKALLANADFKFEKTRVIDVLWREMSHQEIQDVSLLPFHSSLVEFACGYEVVDIFAEVELFDSGLDLGYLLLLP